MKKNLMSCFLFSIAVFGHTAEKPKNLIEGSGFEKWNYSHDMPDGHWQLERNIKRSQDFILERTTTQKHSGKYSLHIKDNTQGKLNHSIYWHTTSQELTKIKGKTIIFSGWIKQVSKTEKKHGISIALWYKTATGKIVSKKVGPEIRGETDWADYTVSINVPFNAILLRAYLNCSIGWGEKGEAYFDDLKLEVLPYSKTTKKPLKNKSTTQSKSRFYFFKDQLLPLWRKKRYGGVYAEFAESSAFSSSKGIRIKSTQKMKPYAGINLFSSRFNKFRDFSAFKSSESKLEFMLRSTLPLQIRIGDKKVYVNDSYKTKLSDNWSLVSIPLSDLTSKQALKYIKTISIQFPKIIKPNQQIDIDEICLVSSTAKIKPSMKKTTTELDKFKVDDEMFDKDNFKRPIIKNGTFYLKNKPVFYLGPWCSDDSLSVDWKRKGPFSGPVYDTPFNQNIATILGMNSMQLSAASQISTKLALNLSITKKEVDQAQAMISFLPSLKGMPFILDFAWIGKISSSLQKEGRLPSEALQQFSDWHAFIPMCPEHPISKKAYHTYFKTGTQFTLKNGGNPFIYEIFNESSYNCKCKYNRQMFVTFAAKKYGNIQQANKIWQTSFASFEQAAQVPQFEYYPGLWIDWCKFSGTRYADVLDEFKNTIKSVDKRKNIYFTEQPTLATIFTYRGSGMDYIKIAENVDVLTVEGGRQFKRNLNLSHKGSNAMEIAMATHNESYSFILDMFTALAKNKKPVINAEHYCGRFLFGKRVPSRKNDFVTTLWHEVIHGVSGSFFYAWCKRQWEWKNFKEAKAMVIDKSYKSYHMLTPYAYPRQCLNGFKQFSEEIDLLKELVLPMPRQKTATVALVYSYPTLRLSNKTQVNIETRINNYYSALLYNNYPIEVLMEEDIPQTDLSRYEAIILPAQSNAYKATLPHMQNYVKAGGIVVCSSRAFSYTEYGNPMDASNFIGLKRTSMIKKTLTIKNKTDKIHILTQEDVELCTAVALIKSIKNKPVLTENILNKGKVYYLTGETSAESMKFLLNDILQRSKILKYAKITTFEGEKLKKTEFQIIDRGDEKLLYLVNWNDSGTKLIKLQLNLRNIKDCYVYNPFSQTIYATANGKITWNSTMLAKGIQLSLFPQKRLILIISPQKPKRIKQTITPETAKQIVIDQQKQEEPERKRLELMEKALLSNYLKEREYTEVNHKNCSFINLKPYVNMAFKDKTDGDKQGGWFDQGANDFHNMPTGSQVLANVPFDIINPDSNNNKSAVILSGPARPYFLKKVTDIPINLKAKNLYFLHTAGWGIKKGETCHYYKVTYQDGTSIEIPIIYGIDINGWWRPLGVLSAKIALESSNLMCGRIGLYCYKWTNPHPDKIMKSLDIISTGNNVVPAIIAITAEQ